MSDVPGEHVTEEPQAERGPVGSRDTGSDEPGGGPVDRPSGTRMRRTAPQSIHRRARPGSTCRLATKAADQTKER